jgi:hypothetical protein
LLIGRAVRLQKSFLDGSLGYPLTCA